MEDKTVHALVIVKEPGKAPYEAMMPVNLVGIVKHTGPYPMMEKLMNDLWVAFSRRGEVDYPEPNCTVFGKTFYGPIVFCYVRDGKWIESFPEGMDAFRLVLNKLYKEA